MKKICFVISGFAYSGAEIVLERYLDENNDLDYHFIILYDNKNILDKFLNKYGDEKVTALNIKHNKLRLHILPQYDINLIKHKLDIVIKSIKPDVIYANNTIESWLIGKYIKRANLKTVSHIHDIKSSIRNPLRRLSIHKSLNLYDEIITVSNATKESWNLLNSHVIYNGINIDKFINDTNISGNIVNIGYIGSISKRKGIDLFLEEAENILKMGYKINIAYSNVEDIQIMNQIKEIQKKYPGDIFIYQNLNELEVIKFYDNIDLLVVPSRHDPLPTVVIECMSRKTLVIGSDVDGIPEMITNKKMIFNNNSSSSIKLKIMELSKLNKLELINIVLEQYEYCKNNFNNQEKIKKINKILKEI